VFRATEKLTAAGPVPDGGETAIHEWLTDTTHVHPAGALKLMVPVPPAAEN
jgi:hypothetical protein